MLTWIKNMDFYVHCSTIYNSQDMKLSTNRLFYTHTHAHTTQSLKKWIKSWHLQQHGGPGGYYTKWNKSMERANII